MSENGKGVKEVQMDKDKVWLGVLLGAYAVWTAGIGQWVASVLLITAAVYLVASVRKVEVK